MLLLKHIKRTSTNAQDPQVVLGFDVECVASVSRSMLCSKRILVWRLNTWFRLHVRETVKWTYVVPTCCALGGRDTSSRSDESLDEALDFGLPKVYILPRSRLSHA